MSTTITISQSISYAQSQIGYRPLNIGTNGDPAITAANLVQQTIIGPPFVWNWNRAAASFLSTTGTQDYQQALANFGFLEKGSFAVPTATITNTALTNGVATYTASNYFQVGDVVKVVGTTNGSGVFNISQQPIASASSTQFTVNLNAANVGSAADTGTASVPPQGEVSNVQNILAVGAELGVPAQIAPFLDDNAGNITFRLLPVPDRVYNVGLLYQKRTPKLITTINDLWSPIPDHYSYIYQRGFLALMMMYVSDARWQTENQKFVAGLLGAAEGLNEMDRNIFQNMWLQTLSEQQVITMKNQQGVQGRGL